MNYDDETSNDSSNCGEQLEIAELFGEQIEIPQGLAENPEIFLEFLNQATWQNLNPSDQAHLIKFLPTFPENDAYEKQVTLRRLFNRENFKFGSPLTDFHEKLQRGYFRPDIAHLRRLMKKSERRQYRGRRKSHAFELLKEVIIGRREVLESAYSAPPGPLKLHRQYLSNNPAGDPVLQKVKKRYFQELAAVRSEVGEYSQSSEDEIYSERAPRGLSKKQRQKLNLLEGSLAASDMNLVTSTLATKPSGFDLETHVTTSSNPFEITDDAFKKMLNAHRKRRFSQEKHPNLNTSGLTFRDVAVRSQFVLQKRPSGAKLSSRRSSSASPHEKIKRKSSSASSTPLHKIKVEQSANDFDQSFAREMKKELEMEASKKSEESTDEEIQHAMEEPIGKKVTIKPPSPVNVQPPPLPPPQLPPAPVAIAPAIPAAPEPEVKAEDEDFHYSQTSELVQDTHVCFFSLLRDIICSSPNHRMRLDKIEVKLRSWETNPISPLNEWFSLVDESWSNLLDSALSFLSGDYPGELQPDDFVPYIEYKATIRSYQWIGAGRDSDSHLLALCSHWLDHREEMTSAPVAVDPEQDEVDMEDVEEDGEPAGDDAVPPPRCPTSWAVWPSTHEEKLSFQEQERQRFANPTRAFTYRLHGYESVVGPVKGIYNSQTASSVLKPRGHNLLAVNRPSYVTVLALVRDAAARLPNGEGTRADMCTLIRDSQFLDLTGALESTLQSVVSGALDRLHYEVDACVRFDTKRKLWVYLHRRRSEAEMEKMHQQYQGLSKTVKKPPRKKAAKKADASNAGKEKESAEKPTKKTKITVRAVSKPKEGEQPPEMASIDVEEALAKIAPARPPETAEMPVVLDAPSQQQEIVTASGKKILIQTTLAGGRAPMKFVTTASSTKLLSGGITKAAEPIQTTLLKPHNVVGAEVQPTLVKSANAASPFIVKNLTAGAQFLTASGQKVQILASGSQNLGQIQSIQLSNGQNILTQSLGSSATGSGASNLLQNIQQVQILTSTGQIITKTLPGATTSANLTARSDGQIGDDGKASVLKTNAATALRCAAGQLGKSAATNVRLVTCHTSAITQTSMTIADAKPTMSLLTSSQRQVLEKDQDGKPKLTAMVQKAGGKLGAQVINVSGVQLLNKPVLAKNNASVLTGVKLVSTQQGVKMVATSATTVVQTAIPTQKVTTTVPKTIQMANQVQATSGVGKVQRANPHIISVEALVQGARGSPANKQGGASLIQLPSSSSGLPQFAVVSQGNILSVAGQTRIIQAQPFSSVTSVTQTQRTLAGGGIVGQQNKSTLSNVRLGTNVTLAGMKPVILAKTQQQSQNVILTSDGTGQGQALVLSSQGAVRGATPGTVTVMQPGGSQQILLPTSFPAGTINLKSLQGLQGLKVIPIASGGQKVYARFVKNPQTQVDVPKPDDK